MGFAQAVKSGFSQYVSFSGRARRSEYWYWVLFTIIVQLVFGIADAVLFDDELGIFSALATIVLLLPGLSVSVRRLHDTNRSGWWLWIVLVPVIGAIALLVFTLMAGTVGENRFGPDPKAAQG